jgi:hypothetical protein
VTAFLAKLELQELAKLKSHFALYNCLVLGHNKYKEVQRVYCNPFLSKMFVMIWPQGIDNGAFVVQ